MRVAKYSANLSTVVDALLKGAFVGALLEAALVEITFPFPLSEAPHPFLVTAFIFALTLLVWMAGLICLALPIWCLLHSIKIRDRQAAILVGATLKSSTYLFLFSHGAGLFFIRGRTVTDSGGVVMLDNQYTLHGYVGLIPWVVLQAALGASIGWMIWQLAYRRRAE